MHGKLQRIQLSLCLIMSLCGLPAFAVESLQFGPAIKARKVASAPLTELQNRPPPAQVAAGAEVVVVSGYEPNSSGLVKVTINRPGKRVLLVLTSYEMVQWQVVATAGSTLAGVWVSSYYPSTLQAPKEVPGYAGRLPYSYELDNANFVSLLSQLNHQLGLRAVQIFRGAYTLPASVNISQPDAPNPLLTLEGPSVEGRGDDFHFALLDVDGQPVNWLPSGPQESKEHGYPVAEKRQVRLGANGPLFRLTSDGLVVKKGTAEKTLPLPASFPRMSWPSGLAYDSKRGVISVLTHGGEGFLYRYHLGKESWLDYRSLNNLDLFSLTYDAKNDRYVAILEREGLLFISGEGQPLFKRAILSRLSGFGRLYDSGNGPPPGLVLAANGPHVVLAYSDGFQIRNIWYYNVTRDQPLLTYTAH